MVPSDHPERPDASGSEVTAFLGTTPDEHQPAPMPTPTPQRLGRYVLLEVVGAGAMGVVYAAYDPELDRRVAVKLIAESRGFRTESSKKRLLREAQAMARVRHPNVVAVHDAGTSDSGTVYLAMEFVEGTTLRAWLDSVTRPWRETLKVLVDAGRGLAAAHAQGVIHRDFKPDNVMVDQRGRPLVLDFGLAHPLGSSAPSTVSGDSQPQVVVTDRLTHSGVVMGTPAYMSPEQFRTRDPDARSDQFSYCVTVWLALFGERPFAGRTAVELVAAIEAGEVQGALRGKVPRRIRSALLRGLSGNPDDRWPSMEALLDQLEPRSRLRVPSLLGIGASLVATGIIAFGLRDDAEPCTGAAARLAHSYDDDDRAAIARAMSGIEAAYAERAWQRTATELDAYAQRWQEQYTDTCRATRVRQEQPESVMEQRMACLRTAEHHFRATVAVLRDLDREVLAEVPNLVAGLPSIEACRDPEATLGSVLPPAPEDAAAVDEIRAMLATAQAMERAGRFSDALSVTDRALEHHEQTDYPPLSVELAQVRGKILTSQQDYEPARDHFERALREATRWGRWDRIGAAAMALMSIAALHDNDSSAAFALAPTIRGLLDRYPGTDLAIFAHSVLGQAYQAFDRHLEAGEEFEAELHVATDRYGDGHEKVAAAYADLGSHYRLLGEMQKSLDAHDRALAVLEQLFGPDHPRLVPQLLSLANATSEIGRREQAERIAARAVEIAADSHGPDAAGTAIARRSYAEILLAAGRSDEALETIELALPVLERSHPPEHHMLAGARRQYARILRSIGRYDEAAALLDRAITLRLRGVDEHHPDITRLQFEAMVLAMDTGDDTRAEELARRQLESRTRTLGPADPATARARDTYAQLLVERGAFDQALELLDDNIGYLEQALGADAIRTLHSRASRANVYLHLRRYERAAAEYTVVVDGFSATYGADDPRTLRRRGSVAMATAEQGLHDEAIAMAQTLLERLDATDASPAARLPVEYAVAEVFAAAERPEAAETHYRAALSRLDATRPGQDDSTRNLIRRRIGDMLVRQGELESAEVMLRDVWEAADSATELGRSGFDYARAVWPRDRAAARRAAEIARDALATAGPGFAADLVEVERWLDRKAVDISD